MVMTLRGSKGVSQMWALVLASVASTLSAIGFDADPWQIDKLRPPTADC